METLGSLKKAVEQKSLRKTRRVILAEGAVKLSKASARLLSELALRISPPSSARKVVPKKLLLALALLKLLSKRLSMQLSHWLLLPFSTAAFSLVALVAALRWKKVAPSKLSQFSLLPFSFRIWASSLLLPKALVLLLVPLQLLQLFRALLSSRELLSVLWILRLASLPLELSALAARSEEFVALQEQPDLMRVAQAWEALAAMEKAGNFAEQRKTHQREIRMEKRAENAKGSQQRVLKGSKVMLPWAALGELELLERRVAELAAISLQMLVAALEKRWQCDARGKTALQRP